MIATRGFTLSIAFALTLATTAHTAPSQVLTELPFTIHDNRILIDVVLNGRGPFTMIFDTGASNVLTPEALERLGITAGGGDSTSGAGEKRVLLGSAPVASMKIGSLEMREQVFLVADLGEVRRAFRFPRLDGIVGAELLERAHATVDFDRGVLRFSEPSPEGSPLPPGAVPIVLEDGSPIVDGRIDGRPARMLIDTGDRSNLTVFRKFAAGSGLDSLFASRPEIPTGVGLGGPIPGRVSTLASVEFGTVRERDVVARLPSTRGGVFAVSPLAGSIGLGLLRNYDLEIDYRHRYFVFSPRHTRSPSRFVPVPDPPASAPASPGH